MKKIYKKLLVDEWQKEFSVIEVSKECFDISPEIETVGTMIGIKIYSLEDLNFRMNILIEKGFSLY